MNNIADDLSNAYSDGLRDGAPKWIKTADRLPDMCGGKFLVAAVNDFCQAKVFTAYTGYMERGKLEFHSCETQFDLAVWHITHWMPLPEPPARRWRNEQGRSSNHHQGHWQARH